MVDSYFLIQPNWEREISLKRRWMTSVQTSLSGKEMRSGLFTWPRKTLKYHITALSAAHMNYIKRKLFTYLHAVYGIPLWPDRTLLTAQADAGQSILAVDSTTDKYFVEGEECVVRDPDDLENYEVGVIDAISATQITLTENLVNTWPADTEVYPVFPARIQATQKLSIITPQIGEIMVEATETYEA